jgi:hypothetical protein
VHSLSLTRRSAFSDGRPRDARRATRAYRLSHQHAWTSLTSVIVTLASSVTPSVQDLSGHEIDDVATIGLR